MVKETVKERTAPEQRKATERVRALLQSRRGRWAALACVAALVVATVIVGLLVLGAGDKRLEGWPSDSPLMEGILPPAQGSISSVHQTAAVVTVYFESFPESELVPYLKALGIPSDGASPYVLKKGDDRLLAVTYDAETERLSLTVVPAE